MKTVALSGILFFRSPTLLATSCIRKKIPRKGSLPSPLRTMTCLKFVLRVNSLWVRSVFLLWFHVYDCFVKCWPWLDLPSCSIFFGDEAVVLLSRISSCLMKLCWFNFTWTFLSFMATSVTMSVRFPLHQNVIPTEVYVQYLSVIHFVCIYPPNFLTLWINDKIIQIRNWLGVPFSWNIILFIYF